MMHQQPIADREQQSVASPEPVGEAFVKAIEPPSHSPYLKVFGVDIGMFEIELPRCTITIGRSEDADITLPNQSVSRTHATITPTEAQFILADAGSTGGTTVNGKTSENHVLEHGDSIQIATYVLQFRTHDPLPGAKAAADRAKALLRSEYCTLPSTMRAEFRTLAFGPSSIFAAGDTLNIGKGGLLIPTSTSPSDETCLELHLTITRSVAKRFLGEVMGVIAEGGAQWMCVKLHTVSRDKHEAIVAGADPGPWTQILPT